MGHHILAHGIAMGGLVGQSCEIDLCFFMVCTLTGEISYIGKMSEM